MKWSRRCEAMSTRQAPLGELSLSFGTCLTWDASGMFLEQPENPASGIPVPADVQRNRFLDKDETKRLVEALAKDENQVAAKAILLLLLTGARRNEITHARWEHVDLNTSTLFVPLSKSGKPRYVVLNTDAVAVLRSIPRLPGNPYVFPSPVTGRPSASLYFPWQRIRTRAGLPEYNPPRPDKLNCTCTGERWLEALHGTLHSWSCKRKSNTTLCAP